MGSLLHCSLSREGLRIDMSYRKSKDTLTFTSSPKKLTKLFGYFFCIVLFLLLIDCTSGASLKRPVHVVSGESSPRTKRSFYFPSMISKYYETEEMPQKRLYEEKRDPLFENMSTAELYRMLQLIEMAGGHRPVTASSNELRGLDSLLNNAIKYPV